MFKKTKIAIFIILSVFITYGVFLVIVPVRSIYSHGMVVKSNLSQIENYIKQDDYESVEILIKQSNDNIAIIQKDLRFLRPLRFVPFVNKKLEAITAIVDSTQGIFKSSSVILNSMSEYGDFSKNDILIYLLKNKNDLTNLKNNFEDLATNLSLIQNVVGVSNNKLFENVNFIKEALKFLEPFNEYVYEITGKNSEKRYLLLFQNNTELRPTGGFIGTYGILTIRNSKVADLFIDDIYHLDSGSIGKLNNYIPPPIAKYLKTKEWYMRDCNFQPDFPSAMGDCIDLYKKESGDSKNIDGVIALTPSVVGELLHVIGAQKVEGVLFEGENFTEDLQKAVELYYSERGVTSWDRKDIIKSLAKSILDGMKDKSISDYSKMLSIIDSNLENKNILLYSTKSEIQEILAGNNWSGSIRQSNSDYLMIVDSNLASYKSDQFLERYVTYIVSRDKNNDLIAEVNIKYVHNGTFSWNSTRYRTYTRILLPIGSELIETIGSMDTDRSEKVGITDKYEAYNKTIFGTFISIEPQTSKTLTFKYKLPRFIKDQISKNKYNLLLQKQPGLERVNYQLNILNFKSNFDLYNDEEVNIN